GPWEEEKRRGITIDLGFAPLPLGDHVQASVVDVPGHEGFVRNMLAGATGIDVALLVVAADEGLMPQTEEHLAIIELLGVGRGIPVITKQDLVEPEWLDLVRSEVSERLKRSRVPWEPSIATSALTGEGLDELRSALRLVANDLVERPAEDLFRLPIDRVFAVAGAGTVVTGSTWTGTVAVGDAVRLLLLEREVRVRSIEVHGLARLVLETPLVARGGDRFVVRSFSPVTTIGGGVVLDPFPAPRPRLRQRRLAAGQLPIERLLVLAQEAGLAGLSTDSLPTR